MRFRLLECETCGRRTWATDADLPLLGHTQGEHRHDWWERYTFFTKDNGPGLAPDQTSYVERDPSRWLARPATRQVATRGDGGAL